ncbi:MAG: hypothetical protein JST26_12155 [Bacteroidetes bacterium]|nr:hypothetical protein [Bacteroidota bacterium]
MRTVKQSTQMDLFPELIAAYRAEQLRKIRQEVQQQEVERHAHMKTIHYADKPIGLKNKTLWHDALANELSEALRSAPLYNRLGKTA